jgi:hypothetical protein
MGSQRWDLVVVGLALLLAGCAIAVHLAARHEPDHPEPRGFVPTLAALASFYLVTALAAGVFLSPGYAVAALLGGAVPMTAVALVFASTRRKTRRGASEREEQLVDTSVDDESAFPGIGMDERTPLGDTTEAHDSITPHDVPRGHPGRSAAEEEARRHGGVTRGNV